MGIACLALAGFATTFSNDFVYDDLNRIVHNPRIKSLDGIPGLILTSHRPLRDFTFSLDYAIWGLHPAGWHLTNSLLHACTALLLFCFLRRVLDQPFLPFMGAALFAVHPAGVEAVAGISNRQESLMTIWILIALLLVRRKSRWALAGAVAALAMALAAKPLALTGLLIVPLYAWWSDGRSRRWMALAGLSASIALLVAISTLKALGTHSYLAALDSWQRMALSFWSLTEYARLLIWPGPVAADIPIPVADSGFVLRATVGVAILFLMVSSLRPYLRHRPHGLLALLGTVTMLPLMNIVPVLFPVAERYFYLPSVFFLPLSILGAQALARRFWPNSLRGRTPAVAFTLIALLFLGRSSVRNRAWSTPESLWTSTLSSHPRSAVAHYNLGTILLDADRKDESIEHLLHATSLRPGHASAWNNLGLAYLGIDDVDRARRSFSRALDIPNRPPSVLFNLACLESRNGQPEAALQWLLLLAEEQPLVRFPLLTDPDLEAFRKSDAFDRLRRALSPGDNPRALDDNAAIRSSEP